MSWIQDKTIMSEKYGTRSYRN